MQTGKIRQILKYQDFVSIESGNDVDVFYQRADVKSNHLMTKAKRISVT